VVRAPVIASHSSAFALANHPRNVPDDVLKLVAQNDGVIMVNFYPGFILPEAARLYQAERELRRQHPQDENYRAALQELRRQNPLPKASVHHVVDHIEHIIQVAGIDHVGLGSDYDGIRTVPKQLEDVSCYPYITQELLNRGHSRAEIHKVLGGNLLRVFRRAEEVARSGKN
jgi:membrane dipeptidase